MGELILKDIPIEDILTPDAKEKYLIMLNSYQKVQEYFSALKGKSSPDDLDKLKIGTMLTFGVLTKIASGKAYADFDKSDWKDITQFVGENYVLKDDQQYSQLVFELYARYIDHSAELLRGHASEKKIDGIHALAAKIRENDTALTNGDISEVTYTEDCLWISLEAMVKLLAAVPVAYLPHEGNLLENFTEAVSMYAFEYGRLLLYKNEQALLTEYLNHQKQLDDNLAKQYAEYLEQLEDKRRMFMKLMNNAFDDDYMERHLATVRLARAVGVAEEDILETMDDIDDFFMN